MGTSQHEATDAYIGYLHQGYYALVVLLDAGDDDAVSVETDDDVTLEGANPKLHQLKHSLDPSPALTVANVGLWKTLRIWAEHVRNGDLWTFVLVTCSPLHAKSSLNALTTDMADRSPVVADLREEANRVMQEVAQARSESRTLPYKDKMPGCEAFLSLAPLQQERLVDRIILRPSSFNATQLPSELAARLDRITPVEKRSQLYERLIEWWDRQIALSLLGRRSRVLHKSELQRQISHLVIEVGEASLPDDFSLLKPDEEELASELGGIMEKQIRLVKGGEQRVTRAAVARWQARNQRDRWMREDLALAPMLDTYDEQLVEEWQGFYGPMCDDTRDCESNTCCQAGLKLLDWSHHDAPREVRPLKPDWQSPFLVRGSYQQLADEKRVGWLPGYDVHPDLQEDA